MGALSNLTAAVNTRLTTGLAALSNANHALAPQMAGITVLTEDTNDLATKIAKAIDQIGLLVLIGEPHYVNESPTAPQRMISTTWTPRAFDELLSSSGRPRFLLDSLGCVP